MPKHLFFFLCFSLFTFAASAQTIWTLTDCLAYARKHNLVLQEASLQEQLSGLSLSQAKAARWPTASFSGSSGYRFGLSENPTTGTLQSSNFFSTGFSLSAGVDLFRWFGKREAVSAAAADARAAAAGTHKAQNDMVLAVQAAYLQALLAKELEVAARQQLQQSVALASITEKKIAAAIAAEPDRLQLRLQVLTDSAALLSAGETRVKSLLRLKAVLGLDAAQPIEVTEVPYNEPEQVLDAETFYQQAAALPEVQGIDHFLAASAHRVKAAKAAKLPSLSFYGSMGSNYVNIPSAQGFVFVPQQPTGAKVQVNGTAYEVMAPAYQVSKMGVTPVFRQLQRNFGQNIGLAFAVPLSSGKSLTLAVRREEMAQLQLGLQKRKMLQELKTAVYTAHAEAVAAQGRREQSRRQAEVAGRLFEAAKKRYEANLLSTQDLLIQLTNWQKAITNATLARYEAAFKLKLLGFYNAMP